MDTDVLKSSSPTDGNLSTSSELLTDTEDQEMSDDDDRNHKHRKREAGPHSFDNNSQEQPLRRASTKRKTYGNGQMFYDNQSTNLGRETFVKQRTMLITKTRFPSDTGPHGRVNQTFHADPGPRFDISASTDHHLAGRSRGRNTVAWGQHDSRFNPLNLVDLTSQITSQGPPTHPGPFIGTGLPGAANMQTASWGAYGFIPGMASRILDPLHQISLQGLQPTITLMNSGMPRQRCRDFEEKGFCLLGDMCSMEHGVNRIVVEDVQSLSQFNLPVATSAHAGVQAGSGSLLSTTTTASHMPGSKPVTGKDDMVADVLDAEGFSTTPGYVEADVYDPDQPLWGNECPETSNAHIRLPLPDDNEKHLITDSSTGKTQHNGVPSENMTKVFLKDIDRQGNSSSVWGRIGRGNQSEAERISSAAACMNDVQFVTKENNTESVLDTAGASQGKHDDGKEFISKTIGMQPLRQPLSNSGHSGGKVLKASRTLYVRGIPQQSNKKESLLSHFQKFGKVVHIHIPLNSEIAFVQFSKKEEAEAALKAPDAVMGNRFINLWWANRDRISGEEGGTSPKKLDQSSGRGELALPSKGHGVRREEGATSAASVGSRPPSLEAPSVIRGHGRDSLASSPKTTISVQKKMENLELLEELRKKQEMLGQKRDEFRRQLDKFEKQAVSVKKAEHSCEQADTKHETDLSNEAAKPITPRKVNACADAKNESGKLQKSNFREVLISPTSKSTVVQNSFIMQTSHLPLPTSSRFKLDNRPTAFRVLPPLPAGFAEVAALKDHFSSYGDLSSVMLDHPEAGSGMEGVNPREHQSACIAFQTRTSAERAYLSGKCWQGHNLHFMWLPIPQSRSGLDIQEFSGSSGSLAGENQAKHATCESSSLPVENSVNNGTITASAATNGEVTIDGKVISSVASDAANSHSKVSCNDSRFLDMQSCEEPRCISNSPS